MCCHSRKSISANCGLHQLLDFGDTHTQLGQRHDQLCSLWIANLIMRFPVQQRGVVIGMMESFFSWCFSLFGGDTCAEAPLPYR